MESPPVSISELREAESLLERLETNFASNAPGPCLCSCLCFIIALSVCLAKSLTTGPGLYYLTYGLLF